MFDRSARSLRLRLMIAIGASMMVVLGALTAAGLYILHRSMAGDEDARIANAASLSKQLVDRVLAERRRQVDLIATAPTVITAARRGGEVSRQKGLIKLGIPALEEMFRDSRSQQVDDGAKRFLTDLLPRLDIAEVMVTDEYGYNAVTTSRSSDFVQSDEAWWQTAWAGTLATAQATADPATQRTVVELSGIVGDRGSKDGVVKVKFGLSVVDSVLAQGSGRAGLRVDLIDSAGKVIASSVPSTRFKPFAGFGAVGTHDDGAAFTLDGDSTRQRGAAVPANGGRWRVVAHMNASDAERAYDQARLGLLACVAVLFGLSMGFLVLAARFIERRITGPAQQLATAAEAVAAGDLSKQVVDIGGDDEIGRLARAVGAMIVELRRLATALRTSATETGNMTMEITASSEQMAASAGQIAHTASDLSQQSTVMAETIQALAGSSEHLVSIASNLDDGAREGVERNTRLRALALDNRARLDASSRSLTTLTSDVEANAAAIDELAHASEEVRTFVTLVQKLARQSKLLALNAAMEAARAGDHGHGFAVVAEEVRRLAAMSSDAAERTEAVVSGVLNGIAQSRSSSDRTVETVRSVRGATEEGSRSFGQIEKAVAEADEWTLSIESAVRAASGLANEMRAKVESLATGTESFAAAMQEVAASSEEQSASTQEIAAAAGTLSHAAERLGRIVSHLRLDEAVLTSAAAPPVPTHTGESPIPIRRSTEISIGRKGVARRSSAAKAKAS